MYNVLSIHVCIVPNVRTRILRECAMSLYPDLNRTLMTISLANALNLGDAYTLLWTGSSSPFGEWLDPLMPSHSLNWNWRIVTHTVMVQNREIYIDISTCRWRNLSSQSMHYFKSSKIHCIKNARKYMEISLCCCCCFSVDTHLLFDKVLKTLLVINFSSISSTDFFFNFAA